MTNAQAIVIVRAAVLLDAWGAVLSAEERVATEEAVRLFRRKGRDPVLQDSAFAIVRQSVDAMAAARDRLGGAPAGEEAA